MDIWEKLYTQAKEEYHSEDVTPFVYVHMKEFLKKHPAFMEQNGTKKKE